MCVCMCWSMPHVHACMYEAINGMYMLTCLEWRSMVCICSHVFGQISASCIFIHVFGWVSVSCILVEGWIRGHTVHT